MQGLSMVSRDGKHFIEYFPASYQLGIVPELIYVLKIPFNFYKLPSSKELPVYLWILSCIYVDITCFAWPLHLKSFQILSKNFNLPVFSTIWLSKLLDCHQIVLFPQQVLCFTLNVICAILKNQSTGRRGILKLCLVGFKGLYYMHQ